MSTEMTVIPSRSAGLERIPAQPQSPLAPRRGRQVASFQPQTMGELMQYAEMISKSNLVPKELQNKPADILLALQHGAEVGLTVAQSLQSVAVINGRPSLFGDAILALVRSARLADGSPLMRAFHEDFITSPDGAIVGAFCETLRAGDPTPTRRQFTIEDAKKAKLIGKPGPWSDYPQRMMQMRARSWALRDTYPDVLRGMHVAEEAMDYQMEGASITAAPIRGAVVPAPVRTRKEAMAELLATPGFKGTRDNRQACADDISALLSRTVTVADLMTISAADLDRAREVCLDRLEEDDSDPFADELLHIEADAGSTSAQAAGL